MALSADRNTPQKSGRRLSFPVKGTTKIYAGALACLNASGLLVPGAAATTLVAVGRACQQVDNSGGGDSDVSCEVEGGVFRWKNSTSTDAITKAEIGDDCYVVDDEQVAKTDGSSARSKAGKVVDVDADGVWVATGLVI